MTGPTGDGDADLARETADLARVIVDQVLPIRPAAPENPDPAVVDVLELRRREMAAPDPGDPLHVRVFASTVAHVQEILNRLRPRPGRYGLVNAATAICLALDALDVAVDLAAPHLPIRDDVGPDPADLAALLGRIEKLRLSVELLNFHTGQHLSRMHLAALSHHPDRVTGPPGSDPAAEVNAIMIDLLRAERAMTDGGTAYRSAIERLGRLRRDPPTT